ncbi:hypothetical protein V502_01533 [Pseudogymnoascus sp. VKM F-4520 (FW-2644)]|nr:hypothetical protein V502_01533 [Pseudogymnoascus sp. VKM F-4520 (FW-2644)]
MSPGTFIEDMTSVRDILRRWYADDDAQKWRLKGSVDEHSLMAELSKSLNMIQATFNEADPILQDPIYKKLNSRLPVLAPITWGADDFPVFTAVNGQWGASYPNPLPSHPLASWTGTDTFTGTKLAVPWEWNHNPDTTKFAVNNGLTLSTATITTDLFEARNTLTHRGLTLSTATITTDLFEARNTLTHRVFGAVSVGTVVLDTSNMADGDICGLAAYRDWSAYMGISRSGSTYTISNVQGMKQDSANNWVTLTDGTTAASATIAMGKVWLRGTMQAAATSMHGVSFEYNLDGSTFKALGGSYTMNTDCSYFIGYSVVVGFLTTQGINLKENGFREAACYTIHLDSDQDGAPGCATASHRLNSGRGIGAPA